MSSADPNQQTNQHHQQPPAQYPDSRYPQSYAQKYLHFDGYYGNFTPAAAPYVQPFYATTAPAPTIAELPAPMSPASPTSTSKQQLNEDELLAHKLQQLEVEDARTRSSSNRRPVNVALASPPNPSPLTTQQSFQSLRLHSKSLPTTTPYSPASSDSSLAPPSVDLLGPPSDQRGLSSLPEVVMEPYQVSKGLPDVAIKRLSMPNRTSSWDNMPIPVEEPSQVPDTVSLDTWSLSAYLEKHHQVPYPPQWSLPPAIMVLHADIKPNPKSDWLDTPETVEWRRYRQAQQTPPSYTFKFKTKGGSFRNPRHSWTMTCFDANLSAKKDHHSVWTYDLKLDINTGMRKSETLTHGREISILTTYVHGLNYDSLRFIGPDNRSYMWASQNPVSSIDGARWDTVRHALFVSEESISDPLYGHIVADHAFWNGRGEEALCIRSRTVDPHLVVASLQVLKDWEKHSLREQKKNSPTAFQISEDAARRRPLGRMSYWRVGDGEAMKKVPGNDSVKSVGEGAGALGILAGAGLALAGSKGANGRQSISGSLLAKSY